MTIGGEISDAIKSINVLSAMQGVAPERIGILGLSMGVVLRHASQDKIHV